MAESKDGSIWRLCSICFRGKCGGLVYGRAHVGNMGQRCPIDGNLETQPIKVYCGIATRGSQYASNSYKELLKRFAIRKSMSHKGNCWDNAVSESFFHTLKTELIHHQTYISREDAKQAVFEYIEVFYNRERMHSANGYKSPVDFELQHKAG